MKTSQATLLALFVWVSCSPKPAIIEKAQDPNHPFYIETKSYPKAKLDLPVGVFDSGTGGLTVLDAMLGFDGYQNGTAKAVADGKRDFLGESFIYLGDQANMPYGNYPSVKKEDLLVEHILKDARFLIGNKYYPSAKAVKASDGKRRVKAIVIACNTATAYGKERIQQLLNEIGLNIKVIGVIGAGVKAALGSVPKDGATIGVFATAGTVKSKGYVKELKQQAAAGGYDITPIQQAGIGLAAAIDGDTDYIKPGNKQIRPDYRGPSLKNTKAPIDKKILRHYGFDWNKDVVYSGEASNPDGIQLNSVEGYVAYHVTTMVAKLKKRKAGHKLRSVILGCTHYPYFTALFKKHLGRLYNLKENGAYIYRDYLAEEIKIVDPSANTARELYVYLQEQKLLSPKINGLQNSEFYISVPNTDNPSVVLNNSGGLDYNYKYIVRQSGSAERYVKQVPFHKGNIPGPTLKRLAKDIPYTYKLIVNFNQTSAKMNSLPGKLRITN